MSLCSGEFGGIGAFVSGHEWVPGQCTTYLEANTPLDEANIYINMTKVSVVSVECATCLMAYRCR